MSEDIQLTKEEELAAARLAGSMMGKICFAGAKLFKGTGIAIEKSTAVTATGLRVMANGIEIGGQKGSQFCYKQSEKLKAKAEDYESDTKEVNEAQTKLNEILAQMKAKGVKPTFNGATVETAK